MKAQLSRASSHNSEGRSIKVNEKEKGFNKKDTCKAINHFFGTNYSFAKNRKDRSQDFNVIIKLGFNRLKIKGHCVNRGDFYISYEEFKKILNLDMSVGSVIDIEIIGVEKLF